MPSLPPRPPPFTDFYGFPPKKEGESANCTVHSFAPASLSLKEYQTISPLEDVSHRHPIIISLIRHIPSNSLILFDLGMSKDWINYTSSDREAAQLQSEFYEPVVEKDVDVVLYEMGFDAKDVDYIVVSHHHFDHTAHPFDRFPNATIVGGPGTLSKIPALNRQSQPPPSSSSPVSPTSPLDSKLPNQKQLNLSWNLDDSPSSKSPNKVLTFSDSYDLFQDGSLLIVPTPGHTPGHIALVARTGDEEFVVLSGDCCHHPNCLYDSKSSASKGGGGGEGGAGDLPRMGMWNDDNDDTNEEGGNDGVYKHSMHEDYLEAERTLERLKHLERERDEVIVVLAHDFVRWNRWQEIEEVEEVEGVVELTGWRKKGLK